MPAIRLLFRSELRRRWASWLSLALILGVAAGAVMGAVAAGRRTVAAFPAFVARYGWDEVVFGIQPPRGLSTLPEVADSVTITEYNTPNLPVGRLTVSANDLNVVLVPERRLGRVAKLVTGRFPDPSAPDQIVVSTNLAEEYGLHIGSLWRVPFYPESQAKAVFQSAGYPPSHGPTIPLRVVGTELSMIEFSGPNQHSIYLSPAFGRDHPGLLTAYETLVSLRSPRDAPLLARDLGRLPQLENLYNGTFRVASEENAIGPQATGWWILAGLAGLATIAIVAQAFSRQALVQSEQYPTLRAIGAKPRLLVSLGAATAATIGLGAAATAFGVAVLLSAFTPFGLARVADPTLGVSLDAPVLAIGTAATLGLAVLLGTIPFARRARAARSPAAAAGATAAGQPRRGRLGWLSAPCALIGTRRAVAPGSGRQRLPVVTALFGTSLAVTALVATTVFAAGLGRLLHTPDLYGRSWQLQFSGSVPGSEVPRLVGAAVRTPGVTDVNYGFGVGSITIGASTVRSIFFGTAKGATMLPAVIGRTPRAADEISLGLTTMREAHAHVGSTILVTFGRLRPTAFRVVGTTTFEPDFSDDLGRGALLTINGAIRAACGTDSGHCAAKARERLNAATGWGVLVRVAPGPVGRRAVAALTHRFPLYVSPLVTPASLVNFGTAVNFPLLLGIILALLGAATFVHLLVVTVARRRRDLGLLRALGFVRWQVAATVSWQATVVASVALLVGIPVGVALGRVIWHTFAFNIGAVPLDVVPPGALVLLALGVLVAANVLALVPALSASRLRPAVALREP